MKTHHLTVESLFGYSNAKPERPAAYLRLKGYWLIRYGFRPGDHVEIIPTDGRLTIRKTKS